MALIDINTPEARDLTSFSAAALRDLSYKELKALAQDRDIAVRSEDNKRALKGTEILVNVMGSRLSESRRLGHLSRKAQRAAQAAMEAAAAPADDS
jgi:hypothetical protein